jgi:hypothetical protein
VLATTVRLWAQRRLRPLARRLRPAQLKGWLITVIAVVVVLVAAGVTTLVVYHGTGVANSHGRTGSRPGSAPGSAPLATAAAVRRQAAAWVTSEAGGSTIVACDPAMCAALEAQRIPASRLLVLEPGQADPLGSDIVIATAAVRSQFGARLASVYAPVTLAAFGTGAAQVTVRVVAADGAAAYRAALASDVKQRRLAGAALAQNPHIRLAAAARAELLAGRVDSRLLTTLATLATLHAVNILSFGDLPGRGASPGVPLRSADISPATPAAAGSSLQALRQFLLAQRPPYQPSALTLVRTAAGQTALQIEFAAPSPLGLLGSRR